MHKQQFLNIVKEPKRLNNIAFRQIRELVNDYPYFQTAYIMLAQKAIVTPDTNIQNVLGKSATYVGDRKRLYTYLQEAKSGRASNVYTKKTVDEASQTKVFDKKNIKAVVAEQDFIPEQDDESTIIMPKKNYITADDETAVIDQDSPAIQSVYEKLLRKSKGKFKVEEEEITDADLWKKKQDDVTEDDTAEVPLDTATIKVKARLAVEQELEDQKDVVEEEKWKKSGDSGRITTAEIKVIQLDVLDDLAKMKNEIEWDTTSHTSDIDLEFDDNSLVEDNHLLRNLKDKVDAYKKRKQTNNVDEWLSKTTGKEKKIEKSKRKKALTADDLKEIKNVVTKNKKQKKGGKMTVNEQVESSLRESSPIISETMAKVYAKQGHYAKAIKIYKQLSLKYPEKKLIFADKILELKKKL